MTTKAGRRAHVGAPWVLVLCCAGVAAACSSDSGSGPPPGGHAGGTGGAGGAAGKGGTPSGGSGGTSGAQAGHGGSGAAPTGDAGAAGGGNEPGSGATGGSRGGRGGKGGSSGHAGKPSTGHGGSAATGTGGESGMRNGEGGALGGEGGEAGARAGSGGTAGGASPGVPALHVSGHQLLDTQGHPVQLRGVNHSGTEYACVGGWEIFDGEMDDDDLSAVTAWHANAMRIPLNEDCWLGINGIATRVGGTAYQDAIAALVTRVIAHGLTPIVELHWAAPGDTVPDGQWPMPDRDHTPAFWSSVAARFGADERVIFELYNEPVPDGWSGDADAWTCWRDGGTCSDDTYVRNGDAIEPYAVAGMQELVTAVRDAGARNVILAGGTRWANDLTQWLAYAPVDPLHNLGAAFHAYSFNSCITGPCLDQYVDSVAKVVPVVMTEFGETDDTDHAYTGEYMRFIEDYFDQRGLGYLAWVWNNWGDSLSLIGSYDGTPLGPYGRDYRAHLLGEDTGAGGAGGEGGGGSGGGPVVTPDPIACQPIASGGLVTDFTYAGGPTDNIPFGTDTTLSGSEYIFGAGLTSDVTGNRWHLTGSVNQPPDYSGFGFYFTASGGSCTKLDASAYGGIEFRLRSNASTPSAIVLSLGTAADEVSAAWLNAYTAPPEPISGYGRCVPSGFPPSRYDGTCVSPSVTIPLTQGPVTTVTLRFSDFAGGVPAASLEPSEITQIGWSFPDGTYAVDLAIDNVRFVQ